MLQPTLTIVGLVLDFVGFCLLLREWWLTYFNEGRQIAMADDVEQARALRALSGRNASEPLRRHLETSGRMMDEAAIRRARAAHLAVRGTRKTMFVLAAALIVLGFLLQIAGAWPV